MRVFICVDMEGVAGVATLDQIVRGGSGYPDARRLMTDEANAAVQGAFDGGATDVVVADSHGTMDNLLVAAVDPRARIVLGGQRVSCMMQGLTPDHDLCLLVGQHTGAGQDGVLAHTFSANFTAVRINGEMATEIAVNTLYAASRGVPVGLVTGDDLLCDIAAAVAPGTRTVRTKTALGWSAVESLAPAAAQKQIREAAAAAVGSAATFDAVPVPPELTIEIDFAHALAADMVAHTGQGERIAPLTVRRAVDDVDGMLRLIMASYHLAALAAQQMAALALRR